VLNVDLQSAPDQLYVFLPGWRSNSPCQALAIEDASRNLSVRERVAMELVEQTSITGDANSPAEATERGALVGR
jgi:hypothetical protein